MDIPHTIARAFISNNWNLHYFDCSVILKQVKNL